MKECPQWRIATQNSLLQSNDWSVVNITDSCRNVLVENCYISVGDDAVAIKSGWNQYGIKYARPCVNITIRNVFAHSLVRYHPLHGLPYELIQI